MPGMTHWQHPNFMAFFPASSSYPGMLGEMWSAALNGAAFNWICSPAVTELETIVLDWLAQAMHLPERYHSTGPCGGGGVIHGTASEAIVTCMVAARDKYLQETMPPRPLSGFANDEEEDQYEERLSLRRSKLIALSSSATHSSARKAALIAGVRFHPIPVTADDGFSMDGTHVRNAVAHLRRRGLEPFFLATTMGTTDTCAIDDFAGIARELRELGPRPGEKGAIWVHVDAAYAGVSLMLPEVRFAGETNGSSSSGNSSSSMLARVPGLFNLPDSESPFLSLNTNLHKWGLVNFDCSVLYLANRRHLTDYLSIMPAYLRNPHSESGLVTDYRDWQIPLGRRFRSLKVWFVLRTYGVKGLQAHLRKGIALGKEFASLVRGEKERMGSLFDVISGPAFALTVLRVKGMTREERNSRTKEVYERINAEGKIYLTSTMLDGEFAIRVCTSTPFIEEEHVRGAYDVLVKTTKEVLKANQA